MRHLVIGILLSLGLFGSIGFFEDAFAGAPTIISSEDFETGFTTWINTSGDSNDCWTRDSGGTTSSLTGPSTGAAATTWYIYYESSDSCSPGTGQFSYLLGPTIDFSAFNNVDVIFYRHMFGSSMGKLALQLEDTTGGTFTEVWSQTGNQGNIWTQFTVNLSSADGTGLRQLRFVATELTAGFRSDMAVDEITITGTTSSPMTGTINIIKDTVPDASQDFAFTDDIAAPNTFSLDDDADGTLSNTESFTTVTAGTYTVTEAAVPGYVTSVACIDPDSGSTLVGTNVATIDLDAGETITCTFTNTAVGDIRINKAPIPSATGNFDFTSTGGITPPIGNIFDGGTVLRANQPIGSYTVTESIEPGFSLIGLTCIDPDGGSTTSVPTRTATIDLDIGETVECTFTNDPETDLTITKSDDVDPIVAGNTLTYTVTVDNAGPNDALDVVVTDTLPAGVTFVSTTGCAEDPAGVPTCSLGTIANGGSAQYTITVTVDSSTTGLITNQASVASSTTLINTGDDSTSEDTTVNASGPVGPTILYGVDSNSDELRVLDRTDASTISSVTITLAGATVNGAQGLAIDPTTGDVYAILKAGGLGFTGRALVTIDPVTGIATLIGDTGDSFAGLEFDATGTLYGLTGDGATISESVFTLSKTTGAATLVCGLGNGDDGETFVNVNEIWYHWSGHTPDPDYIMETFDISSCATTNIPQDFTSDWDEEIIAGAYCPETDQIFLGMDHGGPNDLITTTTDGVATLIGEVDGSFKLAGLACTGTPSIDADLELTKDVDVTSPGFGDTVTFTVTVTNNGPQDATGVEVTDVIPSEITLGSVTPSTGTYVGSLWDIGNLANGATETLTIVGDVNAPISFTNTAEVTAVNENDPDSTPNNGILAEDDQDSAVVTPSILYGSDRNNNLFIVDVNSGAGTLVGTFVPTGSDYSTDIECLPDASACYAQQRNGGFAMEPFDLTTGTLLGPVIPNGAAFNGLEYVGGILYATSITGPLGASTLSTLDPNTGISTPIGLTGVGPISGMAYDTTSGIMYGIAGGGMGGPADLYTIDLGTGIATIVGNTGITAGSLQFGPDGNMYAGGDNTDGGNLYQINTITGASTLIGNPGFGQITGLTLVGTSSPVVPVSTPVATNEGSKVHPRPTITLPFVNPGFCFDLICLPVEHGSVFTHLDLQTVDSGSTHTISLTIHCPSGVEKCNYVAIGASPPGTDMRDSVWKLVLTKNLDGTWTLTKEDPNGDLGDVTATTQKINGNQHLQATFTIEFLLATLLGSPPVGDDFPLGSQIINVEIRDNKGGYASYIFNEGFKVNDIYAYPEVEASYDPPLVYKKLCINEDEKDRKTCAFKMVQEWTIEQAEKKLQELYEQHGNKIE